MCSERLISDFGIYEESFIVQCTGGDSSFSAEAEKERPAIQRAGHIILPYF